MTIFRNPLYTIWGLGLLATKLLQSPPTTAPDGLHERPTPELLRWTRSADSAAKATESVLITLYAAINVALVALWTSSMTNTYAQDAGVRCGALAMAEFAALVLRFFLLLTAVVWGVSIFSRWLASHAARLKPRNNRRPPPPWVVWIFPWVWLIFSSWLFLRMVSIGHALIEHLPNGFPPLHEQANCVELLTGRLDRMEWLLDWLFLPNGSPFR